MAIGSKNKRPWKKEATKTAPKKDEETRDKFHFVAGMFENPKSYGGSSFKDVTIVSNDGIEFTIPKGVRFMLLATKEEAKTPYALYAITKGDEEE